MITNAIPLLNAFGNGSVLSALLRFFHYIGSTQLWRLISRYFYLAGMIFFKMLINRLSYRTVSYLENKTSVYLLEQELPVVNYSARNNVQAEVLALPNVLSVPKLEYGFTNLEIKTFDEFTCSHKAGLFLSDLREYFLKYGIDEQFAKFFITGKSRDEVSDMQRLELLYRTRRNSKYEFEHLLATFPEMEALAYKNESSDKRVVQQWIVHSLYGV